MGYQKKDYDAEIEYLESTGVQRIDSGIHAFDVGSIAFKVSVEGIDDLPMSFLFGTPAIGRYNNSAQRGRILCVKSANYNRIGYVDFGNVGGSRITYNSSTVVQSKHACNVTEEMFSIEEYNGVKGNLWLFAALQSSNRFLYSKCKIYYFQIWDRNDELIRDLIPVRIFSNGFLYDRVTKNLLTSSSAYKQFVLGSDL